MAKDSPRDGVPRPQPSPRADRLPGLQAGGAAGENGKFEIGPGTAYMFEPNEVHGSRAIGEEPVIQIDAFPPAREGYLDTE